MEDERACHRNNCICPHMKCYKGWVDYTVMEKVYIDKDTTAEVEKVYTEPCQTCDPKRYNIIHTSKTTEERNRRLQELSMSKRSQSYEQNEQSKTRVL